VNLFIKSTPEIFVPDQKSHNRAFLSAKTLEGEISGKDRAKIWRGSRLRALPLNQAPTPSGKAFPSKECKYWGKFLFDFFIRSLKRISRLRGRLHLMLNGSPPQKKKSALSSKMGKKEGTASVLRGRKSPRGSEPLYITNSPSITLRGREVLRGRGRRQLDGRREIHLPSLPKGSVSVLLLNILCSSGGKKRTVFDLEERPSIISGKEQQQKERFPKEKEKNNSTRRTTEVVATSRTQEAVSRGRKKASNRAHLVEASSRQRGRPPRRKRRV